MLNGRRSTLNVINLRHHLRHEPALHELRILDTAPEESFDDLATLARYICGTPIAAISLVDTDRQWFKASIGIDQPETPRDLAFCAHAVMGTDLFEIPDATADTRFASNPLVTTDPGIRFYAGSPLVTHDGLSLGTVCVIDRQPKTLTDEQREALRALSRQVVAQLELRRNNRPDP